METHLARRQLWENKQRLGPSCQCLHFTRNRTACSHRVLKDGVGVRVVVLGFFPHQLELREGGVVRVAPLRRSSDRRLRHQPVFSRRRRQETACHTQHPRIGDSHELLCVVGRGCCDDRIHDLAELVVKHRSGDELGAQADLLRIERPLRGTGMLRGSGIRHVWSNKGRWARLEGNCL